MPRRATPTTFTVLLSLAVLATGAGGHCTPQSCDGSSLDGIGAGGSAGTAAARKAMPSVTVTGQRTLSSVVNIRLAGRSDRGATLDFEIVLKSLPTRTYGPDDDKAGARPDAVRLRSIALLRGETVVLEYSTLAQWYVGERLPGAVGTSVLYTGATREYESGRPGPAYFQSRCLVRIPASLLDQPGSDGRATSKATGRPQLRLTTGAGTLILPLEQADSDSLADLSVSGDAPPGFIAEAGVKWWGAGRHWN